MTLTDSYRQLPRDARFRKTCWIFAVISLFAPAIMLRADAGDDRAPDHELARQILAKAGVPGGVVVHLGCGDGRLTAALRAHDRYTVHGLDADADDVIAARQFIASQGVYGPVSVEQLVGPVLPYADSLVNLVVMSGDSVQVSEEEIQRALCPGGAAVKLAPDTRNLKPETFFRSPWPDEIDEWTHYLHDASGNAVAEDAVVGPPRSLQWVAPPLWLRVTSCSAAMSRRSSYLS